MHATELAEFALPLPRPYRAREVFAFHGRDPERLAEEVGPDRIRKGLLMEGTAAVLDIRFDASEVRCRVSADGPLPRRALDSLRAMAAGMLGLRVDPRPFEKTLRDDPLLGPIVRRQAGLRIPLTATVFEALSWAIIGQQINLPFAIQLRRAFILAAGRRHSTGLWCYPDAAAAARLDPDVLRAQKFSGAKAETLVRAARLSAEEGLLGDPRAFPGNFDDPRGGADLVAIAQMESALLAVKGIGPWTVEYVLLRGFGLPDRSLHGDSAVRVALQRAMGRAERIDAETARTVLERYRPHRSMAAAHLWSSLSAAP